MAAAKSRVCASVVTMSLAAASGVGCGGEDFGLDTSAAATGTGGGTGEGGGGTASGGASAGGSSSGGSSNGGSGGSACVDADKDGVTGCDGDCDDADPTTYPGAPEICGDGIDNACGNDPDPATTCSGMGTYVSANAGSDNNPGTKLLPVQTIAKGMANAVALQKAQPVFVAEGNYAEDVTLDEGVDLLGGYSCASMVACTWALDPKLYVSTIACQDDDGIFADHNITRETLVQGFTIIGMPGNGGSTRYSALFIQGGPEIKGNQIVGGDVTNCGWPCGSRGITVDGAPGGPDGVLIERNAIRGGNSSSSTIAVEIVNGGMAEIVGNDIEGGAGEWTRCIGIGGAAGAVEVIDNDLHAGSCNGNDTTFAMYVGQGVSPLIDSNRMNLDPAKLGTCPGFSGNWWTGGIESEGSQAIITNNVIRGVESPRSTALLLADCEGACQLGQAVVNGNTLHGGGMMGGNATISAGVVFKTWKQGQNVFVGRLRNNILLGGSAVQTFGGYEDVNVQGSQSRPQELDNNDIFGAAVLWYQWNGNVGTNHASIMAVNGSVNGATANISQDPLLDATFHLQNGSPCIDTGTQAGGETPTWDVDGDVRPKGAEVDIGADEAG